MFKKLLFAPLFIFFTLNLISQDYEPILKKDAFWDVIKVNRSSRNPCHYNQINRYKIDKDTIIDDKTYKKIKHYAAIGTRSGLYECLHSPYIIDTTKFSFSNHYYREDIAEKKIYRLEIEENDKIENIYYDFSLKVGDTLKYPIFAFSKFATVWKIDRDDENRNRFWLTTKNDGATPYFYTEGLGGKYGFYHDQDYDFRSTYPRLACRGNDMVNNNCNLTLNSAEFLDTRLLQLKIFPNPVKDILTIQNTENSTVKIYSVKGSLLKKVTAKTNLEIDMSSFNTGVYILEISSVNNQKKYKILKQLKPIPTFLFKQK
ncbi:MULTISPECIES: T9SS type A sorting domain-containing protein [unclassified Polaribacter]|uniref:T9SS type A sorting domain-containing protein n=1 Tax=unclassified Polaribacter TaxID=196858 RepID=UPI0011BEB997|nr:MULTISPECIES: T9SS type A sorting domain-containing protein [unclassified Polaribacter]TXD52079.1 T9SS type A sorting domain-containing protein [Polaribacter sp. IC063]TXD59801.1 T9SS type A sorting domain-containing protein [Polaribacter sp. IC066]